jgi:hypothetical protein
MQSRPEHSAILDGDHKLQLLGFFIPFFLPSGQWHSAIVYIDHLLVRLICSQSRRRKKGRRGNQVACCRRCKATTTAAGYSWISSSYKKQVDDTSSHWLMEKDAFYTYIFPLSARTTCCVHSLFTQEYVFS